MTYLLFKNLNLDNNKFFSSLFNPNIHVSIITLITEIKQINSVIKNESFVIFIFEIIGKIGDKRNTIAVGKITFLK